MADDADRAQPESDAFIAEALRRHRAQREVRGPGRTRCKQHDCGEPISEARQRLGADLCEDCQRDVDIRAAQYARGKA